MYSRLKLNLLIKYCQKFSNREMFKGALIFSQQSRMVQSQNGNNERVLSSPTENQ